MSESATNEGGSDDSGMLVPLQQSDNQMVEAAASSQSNKIMQVAHISQIDNVNSMVCGNSYTYTNVYQGAGPSVIDKNEAEDLAEKVALQELKENLKELYKEFNLPRIHWMHKGCDLPLEKYYADLEIDSSKTTIKLEEIFATETSKTKAMKRIFIEGKAGFGKTTLTSKLAYDWATNKEYMQNFELVFILELKRIQNIKSALHQAAKSSGFEKLEMLDSLITKLGNKVLIILDGYDEVSAEDVRDSIHKVLYKENYNKATVAVTCRNGMFDSKNEKLSQYCNLLRRRIEFLDRKINICGLDEMGQKKMLEDFLTTKQSKEFFEKLQRLTEPMSDILKSPLILMLLGFLYANVREIEFNVKSTNLFKDIINGVVSYNIRKEDELINQNIDLFDNRQEEMRVDFFEFGRICLESLETSKFEFEDSDLMERIYRK